MKSRIQFVYFDVGGVILRWKDMLRKLAATHNKSLEVVEEAYFKHEEHSLRGKATLDQLWQKFTSELQIPHRPFDMFAFAMDHFSPIAETHEFLRELISSIPVGILTNVHPGFYKEALNRGHIPDLSYKVVIQSCEVGLIKPEKEIYLLAKGKAGVAHEAILYIDDLEENVQAAKELGWKVVLFDTNNPKKSIREIEGKLKTT